MSLCICVQFPDRMIIGSDTAMTFRMLDGSKRRHVEPVQKSFIIGDTIIFLAGDAKTCFNIASEFDREKTKNITVFRRILKKHNRGLAERYSGERQDMPLNAILFKMDQSGRTVSHTFLPSSHFNPVTRRGTDGGVHIVTGGYEADKVLTRALQTWDDGKDTGEFIRELFEEFSGAEIGGELDLFEFNVNGAYYLGRQRLNETPRIETITVEETFALSAGLVGGTVTGALIRTAAANRRIEVDAQGLRTYDANGTNRIRINTGSDNGVSAITFFGTGGSTAGEINSYQNSGGISLISSDVFIGSNNTGNPIRLQGAVTIDGTVEFRREVTGLNVGIGSVTGLQTQLDAIWAKLNNHTHDITLPTHNHGNSANQNWGGTFTTSRSA